MIILITEKDGHADCSSTVAYQARVVLAGLIRYWQKKKRSLYDGCDGKKLQLLTDGSKAAVLGSSRRHSCWC